ncbi:hypothetical protein WS71_03775 [Burkholderia mayonis]|uniref:Uncharacterized protein n=1 Tax=Burkholderia mayonis TaxID=1385591 RepID=A0A1B4FSC1_9BURK|nr:hypothetical protein WS71_03775 [Burkholderia mayonis]KVE51235.1 hypothetical protein WS71_13065 [Burkholderia mayonis]
MAIFERSVLALEQFVEHRILDMGQGIVTPFEPRHMRGNSDRAATARHGAGHGDDPERGHAHSRDASSID